MLLLFKVYHDTLFLATPHCLHGCIHSIQSIFSTIFKQQLTNISTVLNNTGDITKLLISFNSLDKSQQKVLLSSKLLTESQKEQCTTMATLSAENTKYTAEQIAKTTGISAETLASWGLTKSTDTLTISELAEKAASDSQAKSALEKIIAQNAQAVANGEVTASNITLTASEGSATLATGAFTTAIKANISAMITWMTTNPLGWLTLLAGGIFVVVKAYDTLTVSVEEQKEKMEDAFSTYKDTQSKLSNITTELESQEQAVDDLLKKDKLTYTEKGQLEELQAITQELRIQKNLTEKDKASSQQKAAEEAAKAFKKEFSAYDISEDAIDNYLAQAYKQHTAMPLQYQTDNIAAMIAGHKIYSEYLSEARNNALQDDIDDYSSIVQSFENILFLKVSDLQQQKDAMFDYYQTILDIPYEDLTTKQQEIVDAYSAIPDIIKLVYQQIDPNSWNSMQVDSIFDTAGIEKTKDELVKMAKVGELSPEVIKEYKILNEALDKTTLSAEDLCNELYAIAESKVYDQDSSGSSSSTSFSLSTSEIESIETYQKNIKTLSDALSDLNDLETTDITSLMTEFSSYSSVFEKFGVTGVKGIGDLQGALIEIAETMRDTATKAVPQMTDAITNMFKAISNPKGDIFEARSELNALMELYNSISDSQSMDMQTATSLINKYPKLASAVQKVGEEYSFELGVVRDLVNEKIEYINTVSSYEYDSAIKELETLKQQREAYERKLEAYKYSYEQAHKTLFESMHINVDDYIMQDSTYRSMLSNLDALDSRTEYLNELLEELKEGFSTEELEDTSTNDFEQQIDWAAQSVSNLSDKVSDLETVLDNTKGWEAQLEAIQEVIGAQKDLQEGYRKSRELYLDEYNEALTSGVLAENGLSNSIKNKIESGNLFNIQDFIDENVAKGTDKGTDEQIYDAIQKAMDWYEKYVDADNNYIDIGFQIDDNELEKLNIEAEHLSAVREKLETALNGTISDSDKLGLLSQLSTALENDYQKQIEIAKAEKNTEEAEKLQLELKQELYDLDQQRLELSREITETEIEQLETTRTNIQNQMDLNGGKGTTEQYHALIKNENDLLEKRTAEYESEVSLLQKIGTGIGTNSTEYREQLKVVNECADGIAECKKNTKEWEIALLSLPLEEIEEKIDELNKKLEAVNDEKSDMDDVIAGAQAYIQDEIDGYEELKQVIQDQIDSLQEANDERERALALQKARYELERAMSQRTVKMYSGENKGFIYTQNQDEVRDAKENLSNLEFENTIHQLEKQIDYYDDIIDDLQDIKDAWGNIASEAEDYLNIQKAISAIGEEGIWDYEQIDKYTASYKNLVVTVGELEDAINSWEDFKAGLEEIVEKYEYGAYSSLLEAKGVMRDYAHDYLYGFHRI